MADAVTLLLGKGPNGRTHRHNRRRALIVRRHREMLAEAGREPLIVDAPYGPGDVRRSDDGRMTEDRRDRQRVIAEEYWARRHAIQGGEVPATETAGSPDAYLLQQLPESLVGE